MNRCIDRLTIRRSIMVVSITALSIRAHAANENFDGRYNTGIPYNNNIAARSEEITVNGKITDEKGAPLSGVNIRIKNTEKGVITGEDGSFTITLPDTKTALVITHVGYIVQEVHPNGKNALSISLIPEQGNLNEVVVVGYGTQKRSEVSGAVATLPARNTEEKPINRIEQALIGQMPGVQVRQQTGMAGSGLSILVRGSGSITAGSEPLYVIDGLPLDVSSQNGDGGFSNNPLDNLNPNDIESIQVLKDAAAGAIYGSRAANGVVIITTKKGQTGKMKISVNAKSGIGQVAKKLDLLSPGEWVTMATEVANTAWVNSGVGRTTSQTNNERATLLGLKPDSINTSYMADPRWAIDGHPGLDYIDWQDAVYRKAWYQNYEAAASGGTDNVKYFISGNYLNQDGTLINSNYINYGLRANVEANASKKFKPGINLAPSYSINNSPPAEGKDNQLMKLAQMVPVAESDAGLNTGANGNATYTWSSPRLISPYTFLQTAVNKITATRLLGSVYAEYQIIPGLALKSTVNYDGLDRDTKKYVSDKVTVGASAALTTNPGLNSSGSYNVVKKRNFLNENTLSYNTVINKVHTIAAVAGLSYSSVHYETVNLATAGGFANDIITTLNNAIPSPSNVTYTGTNTESNNTLLSWYGRLQYNLKDKYLLAGTIRRDASSKFGADNRWGTFPSASIGWRISKEAFFQNITAINDLKLRLSWGKSGNNNIGDYNAVQTLASSSYSFAGTAGTGQVVSALANSFLKWETSTTTNLGFDISLLKNRISMTADAYYKKNTDLLLNLPVLAASGFSTSLKNIGAVVNKGLEISLSTVNLRSRGFQWTMNTNIAFNRNEVTALGSDHAPIEIASAYSGNNAPYLLKEGLPAFSFYVTQVEGILTADDISNAKTAKLKNETVGDAKYRDAIEDGIINAKDRIVMGHPMPDYTWGWTNNFRYKDFDLSILIYGQHGGSLLSYLGRAIDFSGSTTANVLGIWRDRWTPDNQNYHAPRGKFGSTYTVPYVTSDWIYSTDFIRVQNITLGYNLKSLFKTYRTINTARIFISLENYFGHDKYKGGVNPEAQNTNASGNNSYAIAGDYGAMPLTKTASVGVTISF
ncbi:MULTISPECIES: SusC/RagA family TonB-linked outer membrane protein [Niastella]|uniref:TonB-dependent receptor n=1 Tax=Niastella soli TaxID=2821487 RepID=A0ABS3YZA1_9BACT|nr:TonB-dependent receptor [Niastella soli]MBO9203068.1 TonB-dependent receptor [Niastella soli]